MYIWRTKTILEAFQKHASNIFDILSAGLDVFNTEEEYSFIETNFPLTPNISVDYAIMEFAENVYTIPADIGWSDLGSWNTLHAFLPKDSGENVLLNTTGFIEDSTNNMIKLSPKKKILIKGLHDFIVIDEDDILMIYPKNKEQEIKNDKDKIILKYHR